jgi:hypothetical protein
MSERNSDSIGKTCRNLNDAQNYAEIWQIVQETTNFAIGKTRRNMMLFLDDLPLKIGAYHPVGTNNIVLNRRLVEIVEASIESKQTVNSLIYNLLLHEYLHAIGELSEIEVRRQVVLVAEKCFGNYHMATIIARKSPWVLLRQIPLNAAQAPKRVMQIVKDFEKTSKYVV